MPTTRTAPGRASTAVNATSAVPVQTSTTDSRPVSWSDRIACLRQRRSMPALSRRFSRSYRAAIASNMAATRVGRLSIGIGATLRRPSAR